MVKISSWGKLTHSEHQLVTFNNRHQVAQTLAQQQPGLAFGNGRSYGDVCLNPQGILWNSRSLDHFIDFDHHTGKLSCESGVLLRDIQQLVVPQGWMLPVTPGTQMITVGGAIANDVHGKNHHRFGTFGMHVLKINLLRTTGELIECSPHLNPQWFAATIAGIGLTGFILSVELQLRPIPSAWLETETIPYTNLDEFFSLADSSQADWEHTVSWVDCLAGKQNRGLFMRANSLPYAPEKAPQKKAKVVPFTPPFSLVNKFSLKPFNNLYFHSKKNKGRTSMHYEPFFYPLDNLLEWNRIYGRKGFYQYQCLVPYPHGKEAIKAMLLEISKSAAGSFLSVLKTFGEQTSPGLLSFPQHGVTLALDFPNKGPKTEQLFTRLDHIVHEAQGRIYLAKDARLAREYFTVSYPHLHEFSKYRDPGISSAMSRRLMDR